MTTHFITDLAALESHYDQPMLASLAKEIAYLHPHYQAFINAAPFAVLATSGPGGLDASPRGDPAGFVVVENDRTLLIPDRRGNNRLDSLRNIVVDPRVAMLFLIPGIGETLRVNGRAQISIEPALLERFRIEGQLPRSVIILHVEAVYFQCSRAILRAGLWDPARRIARETLPSIGTILGDLSKSAIDGSAYDATFAERVRTTLY